MVWLRVTIIVARKTWPQESERSGHVERAVRKQRMNARGQLTFFFSFSLRFQSMPGTTLTYGGVSHLS